MRKRNRHKGNRLFQTAAMTFQFSRCVDEPRRTVQQRFCTEESRKRKNERKKERRRINSTKRKEKKCNKRKEKNNFLSVNRGRRMAATHRPAYRNEIHQMSSRS